MRKLTAFAVLFTLILAASVALADEATVESAGKGQWKIYNLNKELMGSVQKAPDGKFMLVGKTGVYIGVLGTNGDLYFTGRHPTMTPDVAELYLEAVKAIPKLK
jgi:hypothetical protein